VGIHLHLQNQTVIIEWLALLFRYLGGPRIKSRPSPAILSELLCYFPQSLPCKFCDFTSDEVTNASFLILPSLLHIIIFDALLAQLLIAFLNQTIHETEERYVWHVFCCVMQVMELHQGARFLHIGCDEVFQMGECRRCRSQMRETLFLSHVARVASFVRNHYSTLTPIIWDDMLRHLSPQSLEEFHIGELVEPMVRYCELICKMSLLWLSYKQHSCQKREYRTFQMDWGPPSHIFSVFHVSFTRPWS
jgi:hypothetical protein